MRLVDIDNINFEEIADTLSCIAITGLSSSDAEELIKQFIYKQPSYQVLDIISQYSLKEGGNPCDILFKGRKEVK